MPGPYLSTGVASDFLVDLGSPTLAAGDIVYAGRGSATYNVAASNNLSATDLLRVELLPGFGGDFPDTAPLKLVCDRASTGKLLMKWSGKKTYLRSTSMAAGVVYWIELDPAANGQLVLSDVDNELLLQRRGILQATSTADINKYYGCGSANAVLLKSGPTMAECLVGGNAQVDLQRLATLLGVYEQGRLTVSEVVAPTNVYVNGGWLDYRGGAITNLYLYGGTMDLTNLPGPITITNRYAYQPTRILLRRSGVGEPTWTNKPIDYNPPEIVWM